MDTAFEALKRATEQLGSYSAAARAIGVTPQAVSDKIRSGKPASAEWVIPLERATGGKVTRHELRPDLYPMEGAA